MALSKTEQRVIRNVIKRLRCEPVRWPDGTVHAGESDKVREALRGPAALYLDSWVIPALAMLLPGESRNPELADELTRR